MCYEREKNMLWLINQIDNTFISHQIILVLNYSKKSSLSLITCLLLIVIRFTFVVCSLFSSNPRA
jgi:hypothetical protein